MLLPQRRCEVKRVKSLLENSLCAFFSLAFRASSRLEKSRDSAWNTKCAIVLQVAIDFVGRPGVSVAMGRKHGAAERVSRDAFCLAAPR